MWKGRAKSLSSTRPWASCRDLTGALTAGSRLLWHGRPTPGRGGHILPYGGSTLAGLRGHRQGEFGSSLYIIVSGSVEVTAAEDGAGESRRLTCSAGGRLLRRSGHVRIRARDRNCAQHSAVYLPLHQSGQLPFLFSRGGENEIAAARIEQHFAAEDSVYRTAVIYPVQCPTRVH